MFRLKQHICYPGNPKKPNEDAIGYGKDYCFALDGASCLSGVNVMDPESDAAWMVRNVAAALCQRLSAGDDRPTEEILTEILMPLREQYFAKLAELGTDEPDDSPSAGFSLFRQRNGQLEFFGLGDCVGMASLPDRKTFCWLDHDLPNLDNQVLEEMMRLHKEIGLPVIQTRSLCMDILLANRKMRNHPEGYWILDLANPEGLLQAEKRVWALTEPITVASFSDGFAQLTEVFALYKGYPKLFDAIQSTDLEALWEELKQAQDADADCDDYPRFKLRDDTCAIWGVFEP